MTDKTKHYLKVAGQVLAEAKELATKYYDLTGRLSKSYNASVIDYKTMAIFYSEIANPDVWHLVLVSPYSDVVKVKYTKQEGILCSAWYSVCEDPRE